MNGRPADPDDGTSRRSVLAGATAGLAATAGCLRRVRSAANRDRLSKLSLSIVTLPADGDRQAVRIARRLAAALEAVGIGASIEFRSNEEFLRTVLINGDFDCYVGVHPGGTDPAYLYETLHSRYAAEAGWQNPFGYADVDLDERLERARLAEGADRRAAVGDVLETVAREQPFVPLCAPDEVRLARADRYDGWGEDHPASRLGYLGLDPTADGAAADLHATVMDPRPSQNVNPLAAEYRNRGTIVDLLYDSLATDDGGDLVPWLAADWEWDGRSATVTLREDLRFHDGEPLTAADVAFTYRFLEDTSLGRADVGAPAPIYRGAAEAVERVEVHDDRACTLHVTASHEVGERAFTVPILPKHVWAERADPATVPGVEIAAGTTEAVVVDNVPAVGSGPYRFAGRAERDHLALRRYDDHFTLRPAVDLPEPTVEELRFLIDPRSTSAIERIESGEADFTATPLEAYTIESVPEAPELTLIESPSPTFYHVGFNVRVDPLGNPYFRRAVARLLDKAWLAETVFEGYATPIATPLDATAGGEWVPEGLAWDGRDPEVPFFGTDGDLDVGAARAAFENAGFVYDGDELVVRE
ncbi:ABC transporter substrate-binding protein [Salinilacihabitans rarus]|uniref:ABC transporter substrate-binding protein n=1 Tax=Salinilacihabitans rarus TaxID=2961596 RepID=UPI0020C89728|nr:ABC transporter substrate-binding protein [Salinilacihabitans rarus]